LQQQRGKLLEEETKRVYRRTLQNPGEASAAAVPAAAELSQPVKVCNGKRGSGKGALATNPLIHTLDGGQRKNAVWQSATTMRTIATPVKLKCNTKRLTVLATEAATPLQLVMTVAVVASAALQAPAQFEFGG
jgi:hypothetical protein